MEGILTSIGEFLNGIGPLIAICILAFGHWPIHGHHGQTFTETPHKPALA